jgi:protein SCO1/2
VIDFFRKPLNWALIGAGLMLAAMTAFVVFQPVQVIPRLAYGPEYNLVDQNGQPYTEETVANQIVLYGFGYTHDPTETIGQTIDDMRRFQAQIESENFESEISLALILFDDQRDTIEARQQFADQYHLDLSNWYLLSGEAEELKRIIGLGFGIYYEPVPLAELLDGAAESEDYGYLQAHRYVLLDERNILRAEYRTPLDLELAMRDIRYIIKEKNSTGIERGLNEAAHLFLCYPQ